MPEQEPTGFLRADLPWETRENGQRNVPTRRQPEGGALPSYLSLSQVWRSSPRTRQERGSHPDSPSSRHPWAGLFCPRVLSGQHGHGRLLGPRVLAWETGVTRGATRGAPEKQLSTLSAPRGTPFLYERRIQR